jgi:hypothetical protein
VQGAEPEHNGEEEHDGEPQMFTRASYEIRMFFAEFRSAHSPPRLMSNVALAYRGITHFDTALWTSEHDVPA